ncbi:oligomeric golgi complex component, COG2-domain-containing protein [Rhypophila decipiens]|uniref:Conserved oligomeric Golgi complex subunit 2 n=1 Tax=Rhypophila decipiens TaxID=261697 RepID=A0AAN7B3B8_9PEZI|nr:oligomeric golgi complex component, COG2-domain-containing protein [Rhypophila decipiens]
MSNFALPSPKSQQASSYGGFILPSDSSSSPSPPSHASDEEDADLPLPFPEALSRRDFLAPNFDPATYLSNLHTKQNRHQTLEDLRTELRDRSAAISAELLELVNANYTSFLNLGDELSGGEDRVEDVRVALLGFRRQVEDIQSRVRERRVEVGHLNHDLGNVRGAIELGRSMLELDERIGNLEGRLALGSLGKKSGEDTQDDDDGWDEDEFDSQDSQDEEENGAGYVGSSPGKLAALAREYVRADKLADSIGREVPFVRKTEERITRCRNTIILDLNTALKEARKSAKSSTNGQGRIMKFLAIYRLLDAQGEAVRILKEK